MFTISNNQDPFLLRRVVAQNSCSELLVSTFSGVAYAIPETLIAYPTTCAECESRLKRHQTCSRCFTVSYCGRDCQKKHWKRTHSHECKPVDRSEVRDVLMVNRALSHHEESSEDIHFLRALNELERLSSSLCHTAHFLVTGAPFTDVETTRVKLTKAMGLLLESHIESHIESHTDDFIVWWSDSNEHGNVSIRIQSSKPYTICKVYKPYSIRCENIQEFRVTNKVYKNVYDEFKKQYKKENEPDANILNMLFRDMQAMYAMESVIGALFGKIERKDLDMHMHLYTVLINLCKMDTMCPLLAVARRLIQEVDKKEQNELARKRAPQIVVQFPIPFQQLFHRLEIDQENSPFVLFKYLYKIWICGE